MGQGMSEVAPGLYVTSALVARQGKVLDEFGITHVISIQGKPISPFEHREYLLIPARDHISQDLLQFAEQCNDFIHNARLNQGKVLIHCVEGKSRSPTIASLYLMTITEMSWSDIINSLRGVRTLVDPNYAFQKQLKHFYDQLMKQERERLFMKFGQFARIDNDISFVMKNLALYHDDQQRRLGKTVIEMHESKPVTISKTQSDHEQPLDLAPLSPESQKLLDEMFSS